MKDKTIGLIFLLFAILIFGTFIIINNMNYIKDKPTNSNYLGLAKLGLIPNSICHHTKETYISTNVIMQDKYGNKYLILESKFGDEYCTIKI